MKSDSKIKPADRVASVKEYYFSRKLREVAEMNAKGLDIISLGIGGPDRMPAAEVISTLTT
ncbi:MAG: aminotransferase, partial [Paramuribaculum sp.]|nr:aminotransferase [Paramuribaculum sp.]